MRRKHGYAFNAQRSAVHNVVEVTFERNQFALAHGCHHAAPARAEVAGGRELADIRKLEILRCCSHGGEIEKPTQCKPHTTACSHPQPVSPIEFGLTHC